MSRKSRNKMITAIISKYSFDHQKHLDSALSDPLMETTSVSIRLKKRRGFFYQTTKSVIRSDFQYWLVFQSPGYLTEEWIG